VAKKHFLNIALWLLAIVYLWITLTKDVPTWGVIAMLLGVMYGIISTWLEIKNYIGGISRKSNIKERLFFSSLFILLVLLGFVVHRMVEIFSG